MKPRVLKSDHDYEAALAVISRLLAAPAGSAEAEDLELWSLLVETYEAAHYPVPPPDPVEAIRFRMDQQGLSQADLLPYLGSKGRVSEVLARKRPLTLNMIRRLSSGLGIPATSLLGTVDPAPLAARAAPAQPSSL